MSASSPESSEPQQKLRAVPVPQPKRKKIWVTAIAVILVLAVLVSAFLIYHSRFENTEDAQIATHVSSLSARVGGKVAAVYVDENQYVKKGQILVQIDPRNFQNTLMQRTGELGAARSILEYADRNFLRMKRLYRQRAIPRLQLDRAKADYGKAQGNVMSLEAQVAQAKLDLEYATLRAPADGKIAQRSVEPGMVVSAGQPLLNFVPSELPWVIANFKETALTKMRSGQRADISVDVLGKTFRGRVDTFSPATGAEFAVIPPENATGNYIKIVQRVPVKVIFDPGSVHGYEDRLVAGSSVEVKVFVK